MITELIVGAATGCMSYAVVRLGFAQGWISSATFTPEQQHVLALLVGLAVFVSYRVRHDK